MLDVLDISGGKALVLFTAKSDMEEVYSILSQMDLPYKVLMQQSGSSQDHVLNEFKENTNSVLLGTGAYWEGISIEGKMPVQCRNFPFFLFLCQIPLLNTRLLLPKIH